MADGVEGIERGEDGLAHLQRCVARSLKVTGKEAPLSREDAILLLRKFRCRAFLGGGTFGAVFELAGGDRVVKIIPLKLGSSAAPGALGPLHEFMAQKTFAALGLTPAPHKFYSFQVRDTEVEFGLIIMPKIAATLEQWLRHRDPLSERDARRVGLSLLKLMRAARSQGVAHNDVKCNNLAMGSLGWVFFIDLGKAFDEAFLVEVQGLTQQAAARALDLAAAVDAWRLQSSLRKCADRWRQVDEDRREQLLQCLASPVQAWCYEILLKQGVVGSEPERAWWADDASLEALKKEASAAMRKPRRSPPRAPATKKKESFKEVEEV